MLAGLVAFVVVGCSKGSAIKENEVVTEGAKRTAAKGDGQVFKGDGYSLSMPKNWQVIDLRGGDFKKGMAEVSKDPKMANVAAAVEQAAQNKQMKLFAVMAEPVDGFAPNLNILEVPVPMDMPESKVFEENVKQIATMTKAKPEQEIRKLGSTNVLVLRWGTEMMSNPLSMTTALVWKNKTQYVFTFTTNGSQKGKPSKEIDGVIDSIRFD